jgi:hypothetical protein
VRHDWVLAFSNAPGFCHDVPDTEQCVYFYLRVGIRVSSLPLSLLCRYEPLKTDTFSADCLR